MIDARLKLNSSPIALLVATLVLFLWRPIMGELASALPISGAPYTYMQVPSLRPSSRTFPLPSSCRLNVSSKTLALIAAALLVLDYASTAVLSASTAIAYLAGEVTLPFPIVVGALLVLVLFAVISMAGLRDSARVAFGLLALHVSPVSS